MLVSRYFGARDYGKMKTIVSTSLISFLILSIFLGVFGFCFSHLMMSVLQTHADIPVSYTHLDVYKRQIRENVSKHRKNFLHRVTKKPTQQMKTS